MASAASPGTTGPITPVSREQVADGRGRARWRGGRGEIQAPCAPVYHVRAARIRSSAQHMSIAERTVTTDRFLIYEVIVIIKTCQICCENQPASDPRLRHGEGGAWATALAQAIPVPARRERGLGVSSLRVGGQGDGGRDYDARAQREEDTEAQGLASVQVRMTAAEPLISQRCILAKAPHRTWHPRGGVNKRWTQEIRAGPSRVVSAEAKTGTRSETHTRGDHRERGPRKSKAMMAAALLTPSARRPRGCSSDGISAAAASPDLQPSLNMEVRSGPPGGSSGISRGGGAGRGPERSMLCCAVLEDRATALGPRRRRFPPAEKMSLPGESGGPEARRDALPASERGCGKRGAFPSPQQG
ncbi:hypothetical protein JHW43_004488 [Diplocarpon mali]|nr:hypothetical protein JHW43_004488 [Diplocarpon mali]